MHYYSVFGLTLESEFEIVGLLPTANEAADIRINYGDVPDALPEVTGEGVLYQINAHQFRLDVPDVARYFVEDGHAITVQPYDGYDMPSVQIFMLSAGFGALLHQRGMLPLHASSIVCDKGAIVFCGNSGAGKSTTAAAFRQRGYTMLADDISVLTTNSSGELVVVPGIPQQKLWADALIELGETDHQYDRLRPKSEKYAVPILERFQHEPLPVHKVFTLAVHGKPEIIIEPIQGVEKIGRLISHIYHHQFLQQMGENHEHARLLTQLAMDASMFRVVRPGAGYQLAQFINRLEEVITS